ncbi:epithelial membrane protein 3 isoform X1 [Lepidochelys kempii]|uniref:epithelial membrane protein 3 isoform X1 n=1 Tax=Lepidochelys kempii TaxID=8472 RepID=UPI003C6F54CB
MGPGADPRGRTAGWMGPGADPRGRTAGWMGPGADPRGRIPIPGWMGPGGRSGAERGKGSEPGRVRCRAGACRKVAVALLREQRCFLSLRTRHELPPLCHHGPARPHPRAALRCHSGQEWLHAVQALMVLALLFSSFAFILFMYQLYTMERGGLFYATGVCQLLACLSVFTAALIYAIHVSKFHHHRQPGGSFGYCFVLAWLAFPLALLSGIMYIHLRKRE